MRWWIHLTCLLIAATCDESSRFQEVLLKKSILMRTFEVVRLNCARPLSEPQKYDFFSAHWNILQDFFTYWKCQQHWNVNFMHVSTICMHKQQYNFNISQTSETRDSQTKVRLFKVSQRSLSKTKEKHFRIIVHLWTCLSLSAPYGDRW